MSEFTESIEISAPPEQVWAVLADIGRISEWNPGVEGSVQTSAGDVGVGSTRSCELGGRNYLHEEVVVFEPDRRMTIRVTESNLPLASADIRFVLEAYGRGTQVSVSPVYRMKYGILGRVLDALVVRRQYRKGMRGLLLGLKSHAEKGIDVALSE